MLGKESRKCSVCQQTKLVQHFPRSERGEFSLPKMQVCSLCLTTLLNNSAGDDGEGGGGGQIGQNRDAKHLQRDIELETILQKNLKDTFLKTRDSDLQGTTKTLLNKQKVQAEAREYLDEKEEKAKLSKENAPENQEYTADTKTKREKITRLFSVTRYLAKNHLSANLAKDLNRQATQKNFSLFSSANKKDLTTNHTENESQTDALHALSTEQSTMFAKQHTTNSTTADNSEKLEAVIREAQNIFKR